MGLEEKQVDIKDRKGLAVGGAVLLPVGLFFSVFGVDLLIDGFTNYIQMNTLPYFSDAFITVIILALGLLILTLCYQMFTGKVGRQHICTPLLTVVSLGFMMLSIVLAASMISGRSPHGYGAGRAIGGCMTIGGLGLYFSYKRGKRQDQRLHDEGCQPKQVETDSAGR